MKTKIKTGLIKEQSINRCLGCPYHQNGICLFYGRALTDNIVKGKQKFCRVSNIKIFEETVDDKN
jgi:hypothetical protein